MIGPRSAALTRLTDEVPEIVELLARDPLPGPSEPDKAQFFVRPAVGPKMGHPDFYRRRRDQLRVPVNLDPFRARQPAGLHDAYSFLSHREPLLVGQAKRRSARSTSPAEDGRDT